MVTLYSPSDPNVLITKRIIALGGDSVKVWVPYSENRESHLNTDRAPRVQPLAYSDIYQRGVRAVSNSNSSRSNGEWITIEIPQNYAWVEGDASAAKGRTEHKSRDSREFGPVPLGLLTARIEWILWPLSRFGAPAPRP